MQMNGRIENTNNYSFTDPGFNITLENLFSSGLIN